MYKDKVKIFQIPALVFILEIFKIGYDKKNVILYPMFILTYLSYVKKNAFYGILGKPRPFLKKKKKNTLLGPHLSSEYDSFS